MPQVKEAVLNLELNFTEVCELKRKGKKKKQRQLKTDRRGWRKGEKDPRAFPVFPILAHLSLAWATGKVSRGWTQDGLTSSPFHYVTFLHLSFPPSSSYSEEFLLCPQSSCFSPHLLLSSFPSDSLSKLVALFKTEHEPRPRIILGITLSSALFLLYTQCSPIGVPFPQNKGFSSL